MTRNINRTFDKKANSFWNGGELLEGKEGRGWLSAVDNDELQVLVTIYLRTTFRELAVKDFQTLWNHIRQLGKIKKVNKWKNWIMIKNIVLLRWALLFFYGLTTSHSWIVLVRAIKMNSIYQSKTLRTPVKPRRTFTAFFKTAPKQDYNDSLVITI